MKCDQGRRAFMIGCLYAGTASLVLGNARASKSNPDPKIYSLSRRHSIKGLEILEPAFRFLETHPLGEMAPGRYPIDGERIYATISVDKTIAVEKNRFEAHRKYIDVHYLVRGTEMIGYAPVSALKEKQAYLEDKEAALYEVPKKYRRFVLKPGEFVVFFPGQAHMPWGYPEKSEEIRKVVVKVLAA
jgi:biofilm protein TabA